MKEETYNKALRKHMQKIAGYSVDIHDIVWEMLNDGCSANEVIGLLDSIKMYVFNKTVNSTNMSIVDELLEKICGEEE